MNNQTLIILAFLFILFMKNIKENLNPSDSCNGCVGYGCFKGSKHWKKCCGGSGWNNPPDWCRTPFLF